MTDIVVDDTILQTVQEGGTGSGNVDAFLRIHVTGGGDVEQGYNTDGDAGPGGDQDFQYDQVGGNFTHSIELADVPVVEYDGIVYREFFFEIGEPGGSSLTLDDLQILSAETGDLVNFDPSTSDFLDSDTDQLIYQLSSGVLLQEVNTGNGQADYRILIPQSYFDDTSGDANIYLYAKVTDADGTYEEFAIRKDFDPTPFLGIDVVKVTYDLGTDLGDAGDDGDSGDGIVINAGNIVRWTYTVTLGDGALPLADVTVSDDNGTPGDESDDFLAAYVEGDTDGDGLLDADESWLFEAFGAAQVGSYHNTAVASGAYGSHTVSDNDDSSYTGRDEEPPPPESAELHLTKETFCVDEGELHHPISGDIVLNGAAVAWVYTISNTGADGSSISGITLVDDNGTPGDDSDDMILIQNGVAEAGVDLAGDDNANGILDWGETWMVTVNGVAITDWYVNTAVVTGTDVASNEALDPADAFSSYFGAAPSVEVTKVTTGYTSVGVQGTGDGLTFIAGLGVVWTVTVLNDGNVDLTNVIVLDDQPGVVYTLDLSSDIGDDGILSMGETWIYAANGVAVTGPYSNTATVTADTWWGGEALSEDACGNSLQATGSDDSSYTGTGDGLTHGYWMNHTGKGPQANDWGNPDGSVSQTAKFEDYFEGLIRTLTGDNTFTIDIKLEFGGGKNKVTYDDPTLLQAVSIGGGGVNEFAREAVTAYLNAVDEKNGTEYTYMSENDVLLLIADAFNDGGLTMDQVTQVFIANHH